MMREYILVYYEQVIRRTDLGPIHLNFSSIHRNSKHTVDEKKKKKKGFTSAKALLSLKALKTILVVWHALAR